MRSEHPLPKLPIHCTCDPTVAVAQQAFNHPTMPASQQHHRIAAAHTTGPSTIPGASMGTQKHSCTCHPPPACLLGHRPQRRLVHQPWCGLDDSCRQSQTADRNPRAVSMPSPPRLLALSCQLLAAHSTPQHYAPCGFCRLMSPNPSMTATCTRPPCCLQHSSMHCSAASAELQN